MWEGVTPYLSSDAVDAVLRTLAARPVGTQLVFTYVLDEVVTGRFRGDRTEAFRQSAAGGSASGPKRWTASAVGDQIRRVGMSEKSPLCTFTTPDSSGYRATNSGGYSPSIGSPSCCLIIAAFATDFAEKWLFV